MHLTNLLEFASSLKKANLGYRKLIEILRIHIGQGQSKHKHLGVVTYQNSDTDSSMHGKSIKAPLTTIFFG